MVSFTINADLLRDMVNSIIAISPRTYIHLNATDGLTVYAPDNANVCLIDIQYKPAAFCEIKTDSSFTGTVNWSDLQVSLKPIKKGTKKNPAPLVQVTFTDEPGADGIKSFYSVSINGETKKYEQPGENGVRREPRKIEFNTGVSVIIDTDELSHTIRAGRPVSDKTVMVISKNRDLTMAFTGAEYDKLVKTFSYVKPSIDDKPGIGYAVLDATILRDLVRGLDKRSKIMLKMGINIPIELIQDNDICRVHYALAPRVQFDPYEKKIEAKKALKNYRESMYAMLPAIPDIPVCALTTHDIILTELPDKPLSPTSVKSPIFTTYIPYLKLYIEEVPVS